MSTAFKSLAEVALRNVISAHGPYTPSPAAWEDQTLYFLMLDRFSDGKESGYRANSGSPATGGTTPLFATADAGNAIGSAAAASAWRDAGGGWCGGTLKGLESKLGYLARLGITAVWISPLLKQVGFQQTYHGYGTQDFLAVEPNFGTREDLIRLVKTAHSLGIYVILDIILNHSGNVFSYHEGYRGPPWNGQRHSVSGFNDAAGTASLTFQKPAPSSAWPGGAVWPVEFQDPSLFTQKGHIKNWDYEPEFLEGDFEDLKDVTLGQGTLDSYSPSPALEALGEVYKYWIAVADLDGFRIDTVKHMDLGASRWFASVIHEFSQSIGKDRFYCIGEITGGRSRAFRTLEQTGLNAALGIDDIPDRLEYLVKGYRNPTDYFGLFRNSLLIDKESHSWFRDKVVTVLDDHDQVRKGSQKARFCAGGVPPSLVAAVVGLQATSIGIPCIYYGTEQMFDGEGGNDRYLRECMFGGNFGAFRSRARHFFDENAPVYAAIRDILKVRRAHLPLSRGRQYLRDLSRDNLTFYVPELVGGEMASVVAWSRILSDAEMLLALNTGSESESVYAVVDARLNATVGAYECLYSTDSSQLGSTAAVVASPRGKVVQVTVPGRGFTIWRPR